MSLRPSEHAAYPCGLDLEGGTHCMRDADHQGMCATGELSKQLDFEDGNRAAMLSFVERLTEALEGSRVELKRIADVLEDNDGPHGLHVDVTGHLSTGFESDE